MRAEATAERTLALLTELGTDFALQALSKIERGSPQDLDDVRAMLDLGLTDADAIRRTFRNVLPGLFRFPAVDADRLAAQVTAALPD